MMVFKEKGKRRQKDKRVDVPVPCEDIEIVSE
jgi:hypothetical protein